jgi:2-keto-3-deoxy-L-fuconate dehydrogenase
MNRSHCEERSDEAIHLSGLPHDGLLRFARNDDHKHSIQISGETMSDRLKGKRAFVTAAAVGIGRACAVAFAREGATVFATDIDEGKLAALKSEGIAEVAKLDVRDTAAVAAMAKRAGKTDILLNAAGFVHHGTILDCSDEDWDFSFDLNVKSMHRTIKAFLPAMLAGGGGSIVNISSCAALRPPANRYVYSASKAAVSLLTRAIALDFITQGIRCNSICPGTVETPSMLDRAAAVGPQGKRCSSPARRWGGWAPQTKSPAMAVYLASDEAAFTTGVDLVVDGGYML